MLFENDRVVTLVEKEGFAKGTIGVVVSKYAAADETFVIFVCSNKRI